MSTTRELFTRSKAGWLSLSSGEKGLHLSIWILGTVIFNIPALDFTIGHFHGGDYSLLLPSIYGLLLNAILVYGTINLVQSTPPPRIRWAALLSVANWLVLSIVEGVFDGLYFAWYYADLTGSLAIEIVMGCLLMNALFFYLPAMVLGVIRSWLQQRSHTDRILVHNGNEHCYLAPEELLFIAAAGNYVCYHTRRGKILSRQTLAALERQLPKSFVRCHRSYIVNTSLVNTYTAQALLLAEHEVPIGRTFKSQVKSRLCANR
jgi:hypothetical protein